MPLPNIEDLLGPRKAYAQGSPSPSLPPGDAAILNMLSNYLGQIELGGLSYMPSEVGLGNQLRSTVPVMRHMINFIGSLNSSEREQLRNMLSDLHPGTEDVTGTYTVPMQDTELKWDSPEQERRYNEHIIENILPTLDPGESVRYPYIPPDLLPTVEDKGTINVEQSYTATDVPKNADIGHSSNVVNDIRNFLRAKYGVAFPASSRM